MASTFGPRFQGVVPRMEEAALHPGSRDLKNVYIYIYIYIYILEFRARFARAQFSYLDFETRRATKELVGSRSGTLIPFLVIHFSRGVQVVRTTVNTSLNVWTQGFPCLFKHNPS